jgi:ATP-binding cassette subfamily B protein
MNSGLKSLILTARQHGVDLSQELLIQQYQLTEEEPKLKTLTNIAKANSLSSKVLNVSIQQLGALTSSLPAIAPLKNGHYVIIAKIEELDGAQQISILDALAVNPKLETVSTEEFLEAWNGQVVLIKRKYRLQDEDRPFSIGWLLIEAFHQRWLLTQILFFTMVMHLFGFLPIIYIMTVLDKVVNYEAMSTLYAIAIGVLVGHVFNGLFGYLKKYLGVHIISQLEAKLSQKAFGSLMNLPLGFYQQTGRAQLIKAVGQIQNIKRFISQKVFGTILDSTALLIVIPIMTLYSPMLFIVVFTFAMLIAANNIISSRMQRDVVTKASLSENQKQAILSSSILGAEMVKSLAIENLQQQQWESVSAQTIKLQSKVEQMAARSAQISSTLQQIMTVVLIFVGVMLVFEGSLSPGVLIGANMMAGKITAPLIQAVTLLTEIHVFEISVNGLASVLNGPKERQRRGACPNIEGNLKFKGVSFAYKEGSPVLKSVSFDIKSRMKIGIIGSSGSGKSTLCKLTLGLLRPTEGTVFVDDMDAKNIDLLHLRMQMGFVEASNTFFKESIRDNIAKAMPNASMERVQWAAKLAGLHDSVENMPEGYDTMLEEGGDNFASGQKQQLALARALIRNPKFLILDEATSNLGIEDLINLRANMDEIRQGRTLLIVSSQINQVKDADLILVLDKGQLCEVGTHDELLSHDQFYASLWHKERAIFEIDSPKPLEPVLQSQAQSINGNPHVVVTASPDRAIKKRKSYSRRKRT